MINHEHKFIYVHIPKCGGTTIEKLFKVDPSMYNPHILVGMAPHPHPSNGVWLQHTTLKEMRSNFEIRINEFFKFTCVRNPWDRFISSFFYEQQSNSSIKSFEKYVKNPTYINHQHSLSQYDYIIDHEDNPNMDYIMRFENLQEDFNIVCDKIGIPQQQLPHKNATKHKHYTEYYDDETREIVAKRYAGDIEYFGYKFGED